MSLRESVHVYPHPILKRAGLSVEEIARIRTRVEGSEVERNREERQERQSHCRFFPPMRGG